MAAESFEAAHGQPLLGVLGSVHLCISGWTKHQCMCGRILRFCIALYFQTSIQWSDRPAAALQHKSESAKEARGALASQTEARTHKGTHAAERGDLRPKRANREGAQSRPGTVRASFEEHTLRASADSFGRGGHAPIMAVPLWGMGKRQCQILRSMRLRLATAVCILWGARLGSLERTGSLVSELGVQQLASSFSAQAGVSQTAEWIGQSQRGWQASKQFCTGPECAAASEGPWCQNRGTTQAAKAPRPITSSCNHACRGVSRKEDFRQPPITVQTNRDSLPSSVRELVDRHHQDTHRQEARSLHKAIAQRAAAKREIVKLRANREQFLRSWNQYIIQLADLWKHQVAERENAIEAFETSEAQWAKQLKEATADISKLAAGGAVASEDLELDEAMESEELVNRAIAEEHAMEEATKARRENDARILNMMEAAKLAAEQQLQESSCQRDVSRSPRRKGRAPDVDLTTSPVGKTGGDLVDLTHGPN